MTAPVVTPELPAVSIKAMVRLLRDAGASFGEQAFKLQLRRDGLLLPNGEPTQDAVDRGLFKLRMVTYEWGVVSSALVTERGQRYFLRRAELVAISDTQPCPTWCSEPAGHPYTVGAVEGDDDSRDHSCDVGTVGAVSVTVRALERCLPDGSIRLEHPLVDIDEDHDYEFLTAEQSVELAGLLIAASELVKGGSL